MFGSLPEEHPAHSDVAMRRFLNRAEAAILLGMILVVLSLFLAWKREAVSVPLPAVFAGTTVRTGLGLATVFWPLLLCSSVSSALLLWPPDSRARSGFFMVQLVCGLTCMVVTLTHMALLPGVLVALVGSSLLLFGAVDRYG